MGLEVTETINVYCKKCRWKNGNIRKIIKKKTKAYESSEILFTKWLTFSPIIISNTVELYKDPSLPIFWNIFNSVVEKYGQHIIFVFIFKFLN